MSDNVNKPVDFDESASRAGEAAKAAAEQMEEAARDAEAQAAGHSAKAAGHSAKAAGHSAKVDELTDELTRLSDQVAEHAKAVWESDQRKELQGQVAKGLTSVATAVEDQFRKLSANPDTQRFVSKIEEATNKVVESARESKTVQDAAEVMLKGLNSAALSIEKWLGQQKGSTGAATGTTPAPDEPQDIAIQRAFPAAQPPAAPTAPAAPADDDEPLTYV
jgi:chromosome segregation ATPase